MKIRLLAVGTRPPTWVTQAYTEYSRRLPRELPLELVQIPAAKHHADAQKYVRMEGEKMLAQVHKDDWLVALDETGQTLNSRRLADKLEHWRHQGRNVCFAVGGADGLAPAVMQRADECVSLSALTMPHYLVRVVLAEALYRAWTICIGHPYHRA
ncbi:MAG: 23S rRNA (pseudouridine(1915)-N(3))-methyltransferase RlmH [Pseudomonadota bacterium]